MPLLTLSRDPDAVDEGGGSAFGKQWKKLQERLTAAGPVQQAGIIAGFRVFPHPFSASNYLFGLSEVPLAPYAMGTAAGMAPWSVLYAVVGGYGRKLLDGGEALDQVFDDMSGLIEGDLEIAGDGLAVAVGVLGIVLGIRALTNRGKEATEES